MGAETVYEYSDEEEGHLMLRGLEERMIVYVYWLIISLSFLGLGVRFKSVGWVQEG